MCMSVSESLLLQPEQHLLFYLVLYNGVPCRIILKKKMVVLVSNTSWTNLVQLSCLLHENMRLRYITRLFQSQVLVVVKRDLERRAQNSWSSLCTLFG